MNKSIVFYNSKAGKNGANGKDVLSEKLSGKSLEFFDVANGVNYKEILSHSDDSDDIYLVGGDGTINRFVNDTEGLDYKNNIYYYAFGTGNDFFHDIGGKEGEIVLINKYLKNLPTVEVNNKTYRFLNGIGYGIDGYCCEVGDKEKSEGKENINYTSIAIKGLLFFYHPTNCTITVDGKTYEYKKVWLCPTMNGRFYGGGMMPTPNQDRLNKEGTVTSMLFYGKGKLKTLMVFPSIFKGEHVNHKEMVALHEGKDIHVKFDRPTSLQIDGETILGVSEYRVKSSR